ncbi:hypothetical protein TNCV_3906031 [Trichonephila clavipes]|nr:hypothetical protein TNCV_3906031 [Trichonephila clavipes]
MAAGRELSRHLADYLESLQFYHGFGSGLRVADIHIYLNLASIIIRAIGVSIRPKLTGIVRGKSIFTCFAQTSDRLPRLTQTNPIMPDVMDMIESDID